MKQLFKGMGLAVALTLLTLSALQARTGYVSDMLILTFREGPGTTYSVLKTLKSNTPLEVLEEDQGYFKVRLESGEEGWVDKQFVIFDPPKALMVAQLEKEKADLETQLASMARTVDQLKADLEGGKTAAGEKTQALEDKISQMTSENRRLARQLETAKADLAALKAASENVVNTLEVNKTLAAENEKLSRTLAKMEGENSRLFRTGMIKWFLAGVGVLLMGWLIGLMLAGQRRRRGSSLLD